MTALPQENDRQSVAGVSADGNNPLEQQRRAWRSQPCLAQVLDAAPEILLVLNANWQIVFANQAALTCDADTAVGGFGNQRWGDVLGCQYAAAEGGCGSTRFCRLCGGRQAIETAIRGTRDVQDCRLSTCSGAALDLRVTAVPMDWDTQRYAICTLADHRAQKRRRALERLFFHDVLNTAVGVRGLTDLLLEAEGEHASEVRSMIASTAATLVEQIQSQRLLTMAENKELPVSSQPIDSLAFLQGIQAKWLQEAKMRHLNLAVTADSVSVRFLSDEAILSHVLNSLVRNAFDASSRGMVIALGCAAEQQAVVFRVQNSTAMTEDVQLQVFQRSFSTRGPGRGTGTYSVKLLAEQYLAGKAGFRTSGSDGTTFYVRLPSALPGAPHT